MNNFAATLSQLYTLLTDTSKDSVVAKHPSFDATVIDAVAVVYILQPKNNCHVGKYFKIYMKYVVNFLNKTKRIDVVFDVYLESCLKERICTLTGVAATIIIKGNT